MIAQDIHCSACSWPLPPEVWSSEHQQSCPGCGTRVQVRIFPAIAHAKFAGTPEALAAETEASCFYHPQNRAVRPCDQCGRFLCTLCELEIPGRTLCPVCFDTNIRGRKIQDLESSRIMHDSIALGLATVPVLLFWPVIITAPMALFWTIRHWNSPRSVVPRTPIRFYFAALLALGEISLIVLGVVAVLRVRR